MAVKFLLKTGTANVVSAAELASSAVEEAKIASSAVTEGKIASGAVTAAKIANNTITGSQLAAGINLPSDAQLNGTAISSLITAAAGGYDFKEAARTLVIAGDSNFWGGYNDSSSAIPRTTVGGTPYPEIPAYGFVIPESVLGSPLALNTAISANSNLALSDGDRVAFAYTGAGVEPAAGKPTGIYVATRITDTGYDYWRFTRAADADSTAELSLGALVYLTSGDEAGQGLFLGAGQFNSASSLWTPQAAGTTYSAGNGLQLVSTTFSAKSNTSADVPVTVGSSGLSVPLATASVAGAITTDHFQVLKATASKGLTGAKASFETTGTGTTSIGMPYGNLDVNSTSFVEVLVVSRSTTDASKRCVTSLAFALSRGGNGDSELVGDIVVRFKEHDANGIATVAFSLDLSGKAGVNDGFIITGVTGHTIQHQIYMTSQVV